MSNFKINKELSLEWLTILYDFYESEYFTHLEDFINQIYFSNKEIYPIQSRLFKPFQDCKYEDIKIVVIDNRPVKNLKSSGVGRGMMSNSILISDLPIELREFRDCIYESVYGNQIGLTNFDNTLYDYSKSGILFLNSSMCIEKNKDYSEVWKNFIRCVIKEVAKKENIVYLFLNDDNLDLCKYIDKDKNKIIVNTSSRLEIKSEIFLDSNDYVSDIYSISDVSLW